MSFTKHHRGEPPPTDDEMRLRQIDAAIAAAEKWQREKAAREAEEARREAERKAATGAATPSTTWSACAPNW